MTKTALECRLFGVDGTKSQRRGRRQAGQEET